MADYYVNLGISTSGAAGTVGDPFGYNEFATELNGWWDRTYKVKGYHDYVDSLSISSQNNIVESWESTPARVKFSGDTSECVTLGAGANGTIFRRLVIEGNIGQNRPAVIRLSGPTKTVTLESCVVIGYTTQNRATMIEVNASSTLIMNGCSMINLGTGTLSYGVKCVAGPGSAYVTMNSCYIDGPYQFIFSRNGASGTGAYHHCGFYNAGGVVTVNDPSYPFTNSGNNIGDGSSTSQLVGVAHIESMDYETALRPIESSVLIDAGDVTLDGTLDLFGVTRATEIGAAEYVGGPGPLTCWRYTARYNGSNRMFVANGGGKYPSELRVPGNVDISTGRMIDEGQLISPDQFRIIQ